MSNGSGYHVMMDVTMSEEERNATEWREARRDATDTAQSTRQGTRNVVSKERREVVQIQTSGVTLRKLKEQELHAAERRGRAEIELGEATEHRTSETCNEQLMVLKMSKYEDERRGNERRETMGMGSKTCEVVNTSHERREWLSPNDHDVNGRHTRCQTGRSYGERRDATVARRARSKGAWGDR
ncbi:hypothetical protein K438DRAFT_1761138 [Mycena galopus ATCC 62051]|nr:hypothetical protein K438DRAFT_1761138 [Mycena galopus ATCC 62051]